MNDFICPHCRGQLRIGDNIIFRVKNTDKKIALILLNPQIGNYNSIKHPSFKIKDGEELEFHCPLCNIDLRSDIHFSIAKVIMIDEKGGEYDVYFSKISGEHSTYLTKGEEFSVSGEAAGKYTYFKIGDKFKRYLKS
jgi:hypothetical protein